MNETKEKHPCASGLTPDCFRAYPAWARKALVYKLLHILLPKQLTKKLPAIEIPPGYLFPPGLGDLETMDWLSHDFPWLLYPWEGNLPWPPIFVQTFGPGPIRGAGTAGGGGLELGSLLVSTATSNTDYVFGDDSTRVKFAAPVTLPFNARVRAIKIKMGIRGIPLDNIGLKIYVQGLDLKPDILISGGESRTFEGATLPDFDLGQGFVNFFFPDQTGLTLGETYFIVMVRDSGPDPFDYFYVLGSFDALGTCYYQDDSNVWGDAQPVTIEFQVWGYKV